MSLTYSKNKRGETLEHCIDGLTLNFSYWECSCPSNWIHHIDIKECPGCNAWEEDHPNARAEDVELMLTEM